LYEIAAIHKNTFSFGKYRYSQGLKWVGMQGNAIPRTAVPKPQRAFFRGNARSQAGKIVPWECNFSNKPDNLNLVKIIMA